MANVYEIEDLASWYVKPLKLTKLFKIERDNYTCKERMTLAEKPYDSLVFYTRLTRSKDDTNLQIKYFCRPIEENEKNNFDKITSIQKLRASFFKTYTIKKLPKKDTLKMVGLNLNEINNYVRTEQKKVFERI